MAILLKRALVFALVFTISMSIFVPFANAQSSGVSEEEIESLAEDLEFMFEEAVIKDENGIVIGFDYDMLEERFGALPEFEELKDEIANDKENVQEDEEESGKLRNNQVNRCIEKKIKNAWKEFISVATGATLITWLASGQYAKAATTLLKLGVKGNAAGLVATLTYYTVTCVHSVNGWI